METEKEMEGVLIDKIKSSSLGKRGALLEEAMHL
jgi:hypothetical protein